MPLPQDDQVIEGETDAASERFNDLASKWDQRPSTISVTNAMSAAIKKMKWYVTIKEGKEPRVRAMDFGCGTGLLTYNILDTDVFCEVVGVDVAEAMIKAFQQKIKGNQSEYMKRCKLSAICTDLCKISLDTLNSKVGMVINNPGSLQEALLEGFDVLYTLLAFHHIKNPDQMLNEVLKEKFLNNGGRIVVMDYEHDDTKQIFHPPNLIKGDHYEYDGFSEGEVRGWFEKSNEYDCKVKWDLATFEVTKVPFLAPVDPEFLDLIPKIREETYNIIIATCCTVK